MLFFVFRLEKGGTSSIEEVSLGSLVEACCKDLILKETEAPTNQVSSFNCFFCIWKGR